MALRAVNLCASPDQCPASLLPPSWSLSAPTMASRFACFLSLAHLLHLCKGKQKTGGQS
jgi:hypothetical protein